MVVDFVATTRIGLILVEAKAHSDRARWLRAVVRAAKASRTVGRRMPTFSTGTDDLRNDIATIQQLVAGRQPAFGGPSVRIMPVVDDLPPKPLDVLLQETERQARAHEVQARLRIDDVLRELGILHYRDDGEPPVLETSPCGIARLRCAIVPRPPTTCAVQHAHVRFALAA
ncbi:hypothetical protein ACWD4V_00830 [Streptomyces tsukubensis]